MEPIEELIVSCFIDVAISKCVDVSWTKIKKAVINKKDKHQNIESQIYNALVNVIVQLVDKKYKNNQDMIYQAAERLLIAYKDSGCDNIEAVRSGLRILNQYVDYDKYMEFKVLLYQEISKNDYAESYREIRLLQQDNESNKTSRIEHKIDVLGERINETNKRLNISPKDINNISNNQKIKKFKDQKEKYIKSWNSRLFLHIEDKDNPITLSNAFIMPDYKIHQSIKRINFSEDDTLNKIIEKFVKYDKTSTMLITGVPGTGKSSIISWIAEKYKFDNRIIILRFCDWEYEDLEKGILKAIYNTIECKKKDLENKILVIDGFDEMKTLDIRNELLDEFLDSLKDFENFKCIITSRPSYISHKKIHNVLEIQKFNIAKIKRFYKLFKNEQSFNEEGIKQNLEVLGIPVILYMAISANVDTNKNSTKPDLYNRIFAEEGASCIIQI